MDRRDFIKCTLMLSVTFKFNITINFNFVKTEIKNKLKLLKNIDISHESTEGGSINCFVDNINSLKKFELDQYFESGRINSQVYVNDNKIYKIVELITQYNRPIYYNQELALSLNDQEWHSEDKYKITKRELLVKNGIIYENKSLSECNSENIDLLQIVEKYSERLPKIMKKIYS